MRYIALILLTFLMLSSDIVLGTRADNYIPSREDGGNVYLAPTDAGGTQRILLTIDPDTQKLRFDGPVGIGVDPVSTTPIGSTRLLQIGSTSDAASSLYFLEDDDQRWEFWSNGTFAVAQNGVRRLDFQTDGDLYIYQKLGVGKSPVDYKLDVASTAVSVGRLSTYHDTASYGPRLIFSRSSGATIGSEVMTESGDVLGLMSWNGRNSSNVAAGGAMIQAMQIGAAGTGVPGELQFWTSDGTLTQRAVIETDGDLYIYQKLGVGGSPFYNGTDSANIQVHDATQPSICLYDTNATIKGYRATSDGDKFYIQETNQYCENAQSLMSIDDVGNLQTTGRIGVNTAPLASMVLRADFNYAGNMNISLRNQNTGSDNGAKTTMEAVSGTGDAFHAMIAGVWWSHGIDNSDSDRYKISQSATLGTNDRFVMNPNGEASFGGVPIATRKLSVSTNTAGSSAGFAHRNTSGLDVFVTEGDGTVRMEGLDIGTGTELDICTVSLCRATSSRRYKENIVAMNVSSSSNIYKLQPKSFNYRVTGQESFGYIAEEVSQLIPEVITWENIGTEDEPEIVEESVRYKMLSFFVIEEMKKLREWVCSRDDAPEALCVNE